LQLSLDVNDGLSQLIDTSGLRLLWFVLITEYKLSGPKAAEVCNPELGDSEALIYISGLRIL